MWTVNYHTLTFIETTSKYRVAFKKWATVLFVEARHVSWSSVRSHRLLYMIPRAPWGSLSWLLITLLSCTKRAERKLALSENPDCHPPVTPPRPAAKCLSISASTFRALRFGLYLFIYPQIMLDPALDYKKQGKAARDSCLPLLFVLLAGD